MSAALLVACALAPASASAMSARVGDPNLSPRLAELARPGVRSLPGAEQAERLGLAPNGPGSLLREGNRVLVDVHFDGGAIAGLDALRATGARIAAASRRYQTVTVAVTPASLPELADVAGVDSVSENRAPLLYGSASTAAVGAECEGGAVISEGIAQLRVSEARSRYGVDGSGATVGVLSDSFDQATDAADESGPVATHASNDVASGDLPGSGNSCSGEKAPVNVLEDFGPAQGYQATDEGRAMLQIVHDVAPGAALAFATAFKSEVSFAQNIEKLAKAVGAGGGGADVIVDDVAWFEEPFFQDGPIAAAVDRVAADGVAYFSSAGNDNLFEGGNEIASWEAPSFRDSATCPAALLALQGFGSGHCMDFNPSGAVTDDTFGITVAAGATLTLDLQWAEPWFGAQTDLDAFLLDSEGKLIAQEDTDNVNGTQRPVEVLQWENATSAARSVQLALNRCSSTCNPDASGVLTPRLKFALLENGSGVTKTEYPTSAEGDTVGPTIFGHTGASGAVSVAAVRHSDGTQPERYSSRGPVTHYFGPVSGTTPAAALSSAETIAKPDIAATDCGATTFFSFFVGKEAAWRFCGTSAAAPHAAGVAALELEAEPAATVEQIRDAQATTASQVGSFGSDAVGAGLLDADAAIASLLPPAVATITNHPPSRTADSTPSFDFEADPPATFTCGLDGGAALPCSSPFTVADPLPDGSHTFEVDAVEGSTVLGTASFSFTVDTSAPTIAFSRRPAAITADAAPSFAFAAGEPAAFACSFDGAAAQPCLPPYTVAAALPDGPHRFKVTATDQVGNGSAAAVEFSVDTTTPGVTITDRPPERSANPTPIFGFAASVPAAFACSVDAGPAQSCGSPFQAPGRLADGSHAFRVTATDPAGHVGEATAAFIVDTKAPQTFFSAHPKRTLQTRRRAVRASFRLGSDEAGATFVCKIDRGALRPCGPGLSRRFAVGKHTVKVSARDLVGNVDPTAAVFRFRVKRIG